MAKLGITDCKNHYAFLGGDKAKTNLKDCYNEDLLLGDIVMVYHNLELFGEEFTKDNDILEHDVGFIVHNYRKIYLGNEEDCILRIDSDEKIDYDKDNDLILKTGHLSIDTENGNYKLLDVDKIFDYRSYAEDYKQY
jgi:hypothetical protein